MMYNKVRPPGALAVAFMLLALLLGGIVFPGVVQAGSSGCRADPIITLTDGTQIHMIASIDTEMYNVQSVYYEVHAPVGSTVLNVLYTEGILGLHEVVLFYADAPPNQYTTITTVYTDPRNIAVSTTSTVIRLVGVATGSAQGIDRQRLAVELRP